MAGQRLSAGRRREVEPGGYGAGAPGGCGIGAPGGTLPLDPAALAVVDGYLDRLATRLPGYAPLDGETVAELRDDLLEATGDRTGRAPSQAAAARAAVAEFGDADTVAEALRPELAARLARRVAFTLLASGPLVGGAWVLALFLAEAAPLWRWLPLLAAPLLLIGAPAVVLTIASTGRLARWFGPRTALTSGTVAGAAAGAGDLVLLGGSAALLLAPVAPPSWLLALAAAASLARLIFIAHTAARLRGAQRPLAPPPVAA